MSNKNIIFIKSIEQYQKKYRNRSEHLLVVTKKQVEEFDRIHKVEKEYLLKGRKWALIDDKYYEIPRPIRWTWFRNINPAVRVCTYALVLGLLGGGGYGLYSYLKIYPLKPLIKNVNAMNEALAEHKGKFSYPKLAVDYLKTKKNISIDTLKTGNNKFEYAYNLENNEIVLIGTNDEQIKYSKTETKKISDVWRFKDTYTLSTKSNDETYGTYLKKSNELKFDVNGINKSFTNYSRNEDTVIEFNSNIDVGENTKYVLMFSADQTGTSIPKVVTNHNDLIIKGSLNEICHYGHATSITVSTLTDCIYSEFGTVDGDIIVSGEKTINISIKGNEEEVVNSIKVENKNSNIEVSNSNKVGTIYSTNQEIATKLNDIVVVKEGTKSDIVDTQKKEDVDIEKYSGGLGTQRCPYTIDLKIQLKKLSSNHEDGKYYKVASDIDLNNEDFTPIGNGTKPFAAHFDGGNNTIYNLKISNENSAFNGLFGKVSGTPNLLFTTYDQLWDSEKKAIKVVGGKEVTESIEAGYTASIKNVTLANVDIYSNKKSCGAIAGAIINASVKNCKVTSGKILGLKPVGGIVGDCSYSLINNCETGNNLTVEAKEYNVAGIAGAMNYNGGDKSTGGTAIINSTNNAIINAKNLNSTDGNSSGIAGLIQAGKHNLIIGCTNKGLVTSYNDQPGTYSLVSSVAGISSNASRLNITANCSNYGEIKIGDGFNAPYATGLIAHTDKRIYNSINYGKVSGYATRSIAGVYCQANTSTTEDTVMFDCFNEGEIVSTNPNVVPAEVAVTCDTTPITLKDYKFKSTDEFSNYVKGFHGRNVSSLTTCSLIIDNVECENKNNPFIVPLYVREITSANMNFANKIGFENGNIARQVTINISNIDEFVIDADYSKINLVLTGDNVNVKIEQGGKLNSVVVIGSNSTITNKGVINGHIGIEGASISGTNESTGICGGVCFGGAEEKYYGTGNKTFTNYGTITRTESGNNQHLIDCYEGSTCNCRLDNYGTIEYIKPQGSTFRTGIIFLLYNTSGNFDIYEYSGSKISSKNNWAFFAFNNRPAEITKLHYYNGASLLLNNQPQDFDTFFSTTTKLEVIHETN